MYHVYLLHFHQRFKHARHYTGSTNNLRRRMGEHRRGKPLRASSLMVAVHNAGITWEVARTWDFPTETEALDFEFRLKKRMRKLSQYCPCCRHAAQPA